MRQQISPSVDGGTIGGVSRAQTRDRGPPSALAEMLGIPLLSIAPTTDGTTILGYKS